MKKIIVDILMIIAIILEFLSLPIVIHEAVGIGLAFLIILHIKFNKNYFKAIPKGKYDFKRATELIINIGLLISLAVTIISGILCSQKSFKHMKIGKHKMKHIHKSSAVISVVFIGLHLFSVRKKLIRGIKRLNLH